MRTAVLLLFAWTTAGCTAEDPADTASQEADADTDTDTDTDADADTDTDTDTDADTDADTDTDTDTDVDTGLPPCRDGHYTGPFGFEASALGGAIEDRCEGTVELDILEAAEPQIEGTVRCAFKGVIASLGLSSEYGGSLVGALGTHPEASGQLGVAIDTDSVSDDWSGSFEADTLLGAFDGAFTFSYSDRTYEASYTGAFQATLE